MFTNGLHLRAFGRGEEVHRGVITYGSQYRSCGGGGEGDSYGCSDTEEKGDF